MVVYDTGWKTPGTIVGSEFNNPDLMKVEDGLNASTFISLFFGQNTTKKMCSSASSFGFNIPTNFSIMGVEVRVKARIQTGKVGVFSPMGTTYFGGGVILNDYAPSLKYGDINVGDVYTYVTVGGDSDLWGGELTPEIVNDNSFKVSIDSFFSGISESYNAYIDVIEMKVYYAYPTTTTILESFDLNVVNDNYTSGAEISVFDSMMNNNIRLIKVLGKNDVPENTCDDLKKDAIDAYLVPGVKDITGLTSYYDFNETTGSTLNDLHGSNHGSVSGATMNQAGKLGTAYSFDGSNDYVNLGNVSLSNRSFSISLWMANTRGDSYSFIIGGGTGSPNQGLEVGRSDNGKFLLGFFQTALFSTTNVSTDGSWQHWVATFNSSNKEAKIYLNGTLNNETTFGSNYIGEGNLYVGYSPATGGSKYFLGKADELALFIDKVLSSTEVSQIYNSGAGRTYDKTYTQEWLNNSWIEGQTTASMNYDNLTMERATSEDEYATFLLSDIAGDTKTTCQLYVEQVNNEPGCEIVYDLYSKDGEVDTDIPINELHEITNFEATTTKLNNGKIRIHLKNDASVPTSGYPSIKGYAIKFW